MSYCNECNETAPILSCTNLLLVGIVPEDDTYSIYVENNQTGYLNREDVILGVGETTLILDLTKPDKNFYSENFTYTLWATVQSDSLDNKIDITQSAIQFQCATLHFKKAFSEDIIINDGTVSLQVYPL